MSAERISGTEEGGGASAALALMRREPMLVAAIVLFLVFAFTSPVFGSLGNAENILRQTAPVLLLGLGMTLVVLVGGIDLSVGSVVLASSVAAGIVLASGLPSVAAMAAAIAAGAAVGLVNALLIEALRISPVIVTLGSMIAVRGLALVALGEYSSWITIKAPAFDALAKLRIAGLPFDALIALGLALVTWLVLTRTVHGRRLYAVGDNERAARLSGLSVPLYRAGAYVACGAFAGIAGIFFAARTGIVSPSIGVGMEFFAIAVVALGAGGLPAGRIRVSQVVIGTLILMTIFNYMTIRGVPGTWQTTVTGALLLLAMVAGRLVQRDAAGDVAMGEAITDAYARMTRAGALLTRSALGVATIALALVFVFINPRFATWPNAVALVEQNATLAIVAVGAMIGIISRSVDISPGSVIALGAVVAALAGQAGLPWPIALLAGVAACLVVYGINGLIVGRIGLDPLIVTLAAWIWARGLAVSLTDATTIPFDMGFVTLMNTPIVAGFTGSLPLVLLAFLAGWLILRRTPLGLRI